MQQLTRRELLFLLGRAATLAPLAGLPPIGCGGGSSSWSAPPSSGSGSGLTDDEFLDAVEQAAFQFFFNEVDPNTGLIKDHAAATGADAGTLSDSSIASVGFGLTGLCIGAQRNYAPGSQIEERVRTTLSFILNQMPNVHGFFYHFVDMATGDRAQMPHVEVSSVDTTILLCGVLTCRQYFSGNPTIVSLATQIYEQIDWPWMMNGENVMCMGWLPESGFLPSYWNSYDEEMMLYLLAMASPTNPIPPSSWSAFSRPTITYQGLTYIAGAPTLMIHQYSHAWFDFRNKQDAYANYFQNSITATQAHRLFCLSLAPQFPDYSADLWGITPSDSVNGYVSWGGPPATGPIDGSIVPCAAGGSMVFNSADCLQVLRTIRSQYPAAWQKYGFVDAFNPLTGWYEADVIGIDLGIGMLMAENQRTAFVWSTFMSNPEATSAMSIAGFRNV